LPSIKVTRTSGSTIAGPESRARAQCAHPFRTAADESRGTAAGRSLVDEQDAATVRPRLDPESHLCEQSRPPNLVNARTSALGHLSDHLAGMRQTDAPTLGLHFILTHQPVDNEISRCSSPMPEIRRLSRLGLAAHGEGRDPQLLNCANACANFCCGLPSVPQSPPNKSAVENRSNSKDDGCAQIAQRVPGGSHAEDPRQPANVPHDTRRISSRRLACTAAAGLTRSRFPLVALNTVAPASTCPE